MTIRRLLSAFAGTIILVACASIAQAADLAAPTGRVVLEITGNVATVNQDKVAAFDMAMLEAMPAVVLKTTTPWTEGTVEFTGVRLRDLLAKVGAKGSEISAVALNDYKVKVPAEDADKYDVIVAYKRDGKPMPVREKGPLWVMYPFSDNPALKNDLFYSRCIWQLKRMEIH